MIIIIIIMQKNNNGACEEGSTILQNWTFNVSLAYEEKRQHHKYITKHWGQCTQSIMKCFTFKIFNKRHPLRCIVLFDRLFCERQIKIQVKSRSWLILRPNWQCLLLQNVHTVGVPSNRQYKQHTHFREKCKLYIILI